MELALLICDIQKAHPAQDAEFFLVYRKDTHPTVGAFFEGIAQPVFARALARPARNHDVGWPGGANMLAASAFIELALLTVEGTCRNDGFLLFEPDCLPMATDWLDQLAAEWEAVKQDGKEAFGHWHQQGEAETLHMNGNAVFRTDFYYKHPQLIVGPATQGWDYWFREHLIALSKDSNLIHQLYNTYGVSYETYSTLTKNGVRPAFLHGIKTPDGRVHARKYLIGGEVIFSDH